MRVNDSDRLILPSLIMGQAFDVIRRKFFARLVCGWSRLLVINSCNRRDLRLFFRRLAQRLEVTRAEKDVC